MHSRRNPYAIYRKGLGLEGDSGVLVPWWSITKSVLAAAVLRLAESHALELDARFEDWPFTIRQLLRHSSGLTNYGGPIYQRAVSDGDPVWTVEELLSRRNARKLMFPPGTDWAYSNIGYLFVRQVIERTFGSNIDNALKQLVFKPLGIMETQIATTPEDMATTLWGNTNNYDPRWVYHGLLIGPPTDAVLFLSRLLSGALVSAETLKMMLHSRSLGDAVPNRPWMQTGYGLGLMVGSMNGAGLTIGHSGVGHDTVSALYAFSELPGCPVIAAFCQGTDEGIAEYETIHIAAGE